MNPHFKRDQPTDRCLPSRVYARLDHVERPNPGSLEMLLAFDAVDAQWLVNRATFDPRFDLDQPDRVLWAQANQPIEPPVPGQGRGTFDDAPLFRIEVEHRMGQPLFKFGTPDFIDTGRTGSGLAALEAAWFVLHLKADEVDEGAPALVYSGLFAAPANAVVTGTMPSATQGKALSGIFSLASLPTLTTSQLELRLAAAVADLLAVYDVGQGNCNALLEENLSAAAPTLYYDLRAGVYRIRHTTPPSLVFCFTHNPPILLSHWDADHWAGTYATAVGGVYPALLRHWFAPMQTVGPVHVAFAHGVVSTGGAMWTYAPAAGTIGSRALTGNRTLRFALGSGSDRNNTGIVVAVEDDLALPKRSWVLTGDCDYDHFLTHLNPHPPVGLVAPHHGADLASGALAPAPVKLPSKYRRLVYSFGAGNKHGTRYGTKQHPTTGGMSLHAVPGWNHGSWSSVTPGQLSAGADVLETEVHGIPPATGSALGGCLVAWDKVPSPVKPPCATPTPFCTISPVRA